MGDKEWEAIRRLSERLDRLQQELWALKASQGAWAHPVESALSQRGFPVATHGDMTHVMLPPEAPQWAADRLYELLRRYSFRLFVRDLIHSSGAPSLESLTRYCSLKTVRSYLRELEHIGVISLEAQGRWQWVRGPVPSFGPTLEWFVWQIFQREFLAPAIFNVRLDRTRHGGDYDVIALVNHRLVVVEVKSSPPRGVEMPAVKAFLNRLGEVQPDVAVFLVDTELRMRDKIALLFQEALAESGKEESIEVNRLVHELFHVNHRLYLINSRRGIYSNIRVCLRDAFRWHPMPGRFPGHEESRHASGL
ncbi:MAG: hypothetical protein WHS86_04425 [Desulfosoma sp.]